MYGLIAGFVATAVGGMIVGFGASKMTKEAREARAKAAAERVQLAKDEREKREAEEYARREIERSKEREHVRTLTPEGQRSYMEMRAAAAREHNARIVTAERNAKIARALATGIGIIAKAKGLWGLLFAARTLADGIVEALTAVGRWLSRKPAIAAPALAAAA